jgi:hypothetical protein
MEKVAILIPACPNPALFPNRRIVPEEGKRSHCLVHGTAGDVLRQLTRVTIACPSHAAPAAHRSAADRLYDGMRQDKADTWRPRE